MKTTFKLFSSAMLLLGAVLLLHQSCKKEPPPPPEPDTGIIQISVDSNNDGVLGDTDDFNGDGKVNSLDLQTRDLLRNIFENYKAGVLAEINLHADFNQLKRVYFQSDTSKNPVRYALELHLPDGTAAGYLFWVVGETSPNVISYGVHELFVGTATFFDASTAVGMHLNLSSFQVTYAASGYWQCVGKCINDSIVTTAPGTVIAGVCAACLVEPSKISCIACVSAVGTIGALCAWECW
ncbi:MAG: hypothetical protein KF734_01030 [Saprospiraceae bacterium]|nr:hypothetical protein [Saprospiraceae bacterium]